MNPLGCDIVRLLLYFFIKDNKMPTISMFYGIIILMRYNEHNPPHFHAKYAGMEATFTVDGELLEGDIPLNKRKLVEAWAVLHSEELSANWELAKNNSKLYEIEPLK
jgi:hypothetical protein